MSEAGRTGTPTRGTRALRLLSRPGRVVARLLLGGTVIAGALRPTVAAPDGSDGPITIPVENVPAERRDRVQAVLDDSSIDIDLGWREVDCRERSYGYLLDRLDVTGAVTQARKISKHVVKKEKVGDGEPRTWWVDDRDGATATVRLVHSEKGLRIYEADGEIKVSVLPIVRGRGVICVRYEQQEKDGGGVQTVTGARVVMRLQSEALHRMSKALHRILEDAVAERLAGIIIAATDVSELVDAEPAKVRDDLRAAPDVSEEEVAGFEARFLFR